MSEFYKAVQTRRSQYVISKDVELSNERINEILSEALKHTPTSFNAQSGRVVLLLNGEHDALWELTRDALKAIVPEEAFDETSSKIDLFKNGYGTVLFFEDDVPVQSLQEQFPLYKDNFPIWSQHSSGMLQYIVWTAFAHEGLGATLQHYTELIESAVKEKWQVPDSWKLVAQMPFGKPVGEANPKEYMAVSDRLLVHS